MERPFGRRVQPLHVVDGHNDGHIGGDKVEHRHEAHAGGPEIDGLAHRLAHERGGKGAFLRLR
ncbi:MAG TPA: hypothetical protein VL337_15270 [Acidimicrobiales bacterium]|nr:hypothetical protein [Acidimicrobiales bacterium]